MSSPCLEPLGFKGSKTMMLQLMLQNNFQSVKELSSKRDEPTQKETFEIVATGRQS
jgi:hypothetical protein